MRQKCWLAGMAILLLLPVLLFPLQPDMKNYRADAQTADAATKPVQWLEEHWPFRTALITARGTVLQWLGSSGSDQVTQGKDGFLYYTETLTASQPNNSQSIEQLCRLQQELAAQGQTLYVLIAPDKRSIYAEKLPYTCVLLPESELASIQESLGRAGIPAIDAHSALLSAKQEGQVYYSGDTHWNACGALAVYRAMMEVCGMTDAPLYEETTFTEGEAGDLQVLCLPGLSTVEPDAAPVLERSYRTVKPIRTMNDMKIETTSDTTDHSLLLIRDSFGAGLFPYLANSMGHLVLSRGYTGIAEQAAACGADTVIVEIVQRNFAGLTLYEADE